MFVFKCPVAAGSHIDVTETQYTIFTTTIRSTIFTDNTGGVCVTINKRK